MYLFIHTALKTMLIRPCQYIHTVLLIYSYGPRKIFIQPCHTDHLDYLIKVLRTGCFCIGPGIDFRSAVLALRTTGLGTNTANLESIPGPIQKQPVSNTTFVYYKHKILIRYDICFFPLLFPTNRSIIKEIVY